mmetsp:Transcript_18091/g.21984  ORF Transcript_18091/g.21984 Transcript_18091/m.21984 type:complete len:128 (-) Transcript_18091:36-419(-)
MGTWMLFQTGRMQEAVTVAEIVTETILEKESDFGMITGEERIQENLIEIGAEEMKGRGIGREEMRGRDIGKETTERGIEIETIEIEIGTIEIEIIEAERERGGGRERDIDIEAGGRSYRLLLTLLVQ